MTAEREQGIRSTLPPHAVGGGWYSEAASDLLRALDAAREEALTQQRRAEAAERHVAMVVAALDGAETQLANTDRERDDLRTQLATARAAHAEAIARVEAVCDEDRKTACAVLLARVEQAETALVGLREAFGGYKATPSGALRRSALASTTDLATRTRARLRAEALSEAAEADMPFAYPPISAVHMRADVRAWLRARAEAERAK
jgi:chromosome segregation ATPase